MNRSIVSTTKERKSKLKSNNRKYFKHNNMEKQIAIILHVEKGKTRLKI